MKAILLSEPEQLAMIELPDPNPRRGEVVLRIEACSVCGSDLEGYHGIHPTMVLPRVMGHEYSGVVVELGEGVSTPGMGDRVASVGNTACGRCDACKSGAIEKCVKRVSPGFTANGAYAEFLVVPADSCHPIPEGISFEVAAVAQPFSIAYHAVAERAAVTESDWVLVQGCGPIGLGAMMHAKAAGATVMCSDPVDFRRDMAKRLGADYAVDPNSEDIAEIIMETNGGARADIVIECVGSDQDDTIPEAVRSVKNRGLVVVVGSFATNRATVPIIDFKFHEKRLIGSQSMPSGYDKTFERLVDGSINAEPIITHRFGLEGVPEALRLMDGKLDGIVKAIIEPARSE